MTSVSTIAIWTTSPARSRMALTVDTRTATEYGVVRTFAQADFQFTTFNSNNLNPATFITNSAGNGLNVC